MIKKKKNLYWVSQNLGPKPSFFNIFPKFLQKWTQRTLFTLFWYPWPHMQKFSGGPRTLTKNLWYLKIISTSVCKKIFLNKAKELFCTWCPKSAVPPRTQNVGNFFFIGTSAKNYCIRSQIFRYGLIEDFLSKWQKS